MHSHTYTVHRYTHAYMYLHILHNICIHTYINTFIHTCIHTYYMHTHTCINICMHICIHHGRKLRGFGGRSLPKCEVGDGQCIRPPNISRSSVIGSVAKYRVQNSRDREKTDKNRLMTKKKKAHQKFSALKWKLFRKKGHESFCR